MCACSYGGEDPAGAAAAGENRSPAPRRTPRPGGQRVCAAGAPFPGGRCTSGAPLPGDGGAARERSGTAAGLGPGRRFGVGGGLRGGAGAEGGLGG